MPVGTGTREDTNYVSLSIDGRDMGWYQTMTGGEVDSEESLFFPGGGGARVSLGGRRIYGNITLGRNYDYARDHPLWGWLVSRVGAGDAAIGRQPVDVDGNVQGQPIVYRATLKTLTPGDIDANGTDPSDYEMEFTVYSIAAA
jgi:hypothetical protein